MEDLYGNEIAIEKYVVTFSHATGTDTAVFGGHDIPRDQEAIASILRYLPRMGYANPVVLEWTDRTGTDRVEELS